jgi:hypothetical protein
LAGLGLALRQTVTGCHDHRQLRVNLLQPGSQLAAGHLLKGNVDDSEGGLMKAHQEDRFVPPVCLAHPESLALQVGRQSLGGAFVGVSDEDGDPGGEVWSMSCHGRACIAQEACQRMKTASYEIDVPEWRRKRSTALPLWQNQLWGGISEARTP